MTEEQWVPLNRANTSADPFVQFAAWYEDAASQMREREAICVATVDGKGQAHARMVLLRGFDERGFVFFTNYQGAKGQELEAQPRAAILWYCEALGRQIRIEGPVQKVSEGESDEYFDSRPHGHQVGAHASQQSSSVASRAELEAQVAEAEARFADGKVPRPPHWGGYRVIPERFEFWQHRRDRIHDRLIYEASGQGWSISRIQP